MVRSYGLGVIGATLVVYTVVAPCLATVYSVGDSSGWTVGADYSYWVAGKTFTVGDTLVFNYGIGHTVNEVSDSGDYNTCTVDNPITTDGSGSTEIPLETEGPHYFICASLGHCQNGMKLAVYVGPPAFSQTTAGTFSEI